MTKSLYADRETVGEIALKAQLSPQSIEVGDMSRELMPQLVEDLNNSIQSNPFDGKPFYIIIHEKKDLMLKNVILRRMLVSERRPYPESNTSVFWTNPQSGEVKFCWSIPHWTTFEYYLANAAKFDKELIKDIVAYQMNRLDHFGFSKIGMSEEKIPIYVPTKNFKDRALRNTKQQFKAC